MTEENNMRWISGFWRRVGALFIDTIILGIVGLGLGFALETQFVELGGWGRFVGFFIALVYFGVMNSSISGGQTFGKGTVQQLIDLNSMLPKEQDKVGQVKMTVQNSSDKPALSTIH